MDELYQRFLAHQEEQRQTVQNEFARIDRSKDQFGERIKQLETVGNKIAEIIDSASSQIAKHLELLISSEETARKDMEPPLPCNDISRHTFAELALQFKSDCMSTYN